jgi:hypothetical protein
MMPPTCSRRRPVSDVVGGVFDLCEMIEMFVCAFGAFVVTMVAHEEIEEDSILARHGEGARSVHTSLTGDID